MQTNTEKEFLDSIKGLEKNHDVAIHRYLKTGNKQYKTMAMYYMSRAEEEKRNYYEFLETR